MQGSAGSFLCFQLIPAHEENAHGVSHNMLMLVLPFLSPRQLHFALGIVLLQADSLTAWVCPSCRRNGQLSPVGGIGPVVMLQGG